MTQKLLKANGKIVYYLTVQSLTPDEWKDEGMKAHHHEYDQTIWQLLGDPLLYVDLKNDPELADIETPSFEPYDDEEGTRTYVPDIDDLDPHTHDCYVGAEVELSIGDQVLSGIVRGRKRQSDGTLRGTVHPNPS